MEKLGGESTGQRWMEAENQVDQGPLWAVAQLMMMMKYTTNVVICFTVVLYAHCFN
jgi:hypothetical protein